MEEREPSAHFQRRHISRLGTIGGDVRVAFTRCTVHAGRVDRIEGPVVGDTRVQVRTDNERVVKGNQIAPARYQYLSKGVGIHARSIGGLRGTAMSVVTTMGWV